MTVAETNPSNSNQEPSLSNQSQEANFPSVERRRYDLMRGAVHDIRSPISNIKGYAELFQGIIPSGLTNDCLAIDQVLKGLRRGDDPTSTVADALISEPTPEGTMQVVDFLANIRHQHYPETALEEVRQEILASSANVEFGLYDLAAMEMSFYARHMEESLASFELKPSAIPSHYPFTPQDIEGGIGVIQNNIARLHRYVDESRFLIHIDSLASVRVDFSPGLLFDQLVSQFGSSLALASPAPELSYHTDLPVELTINSDPIFIERIFTNLVENARKYGSKDNPLITISSSQDEQGITLSVADNGIGFKPGDQIGKIPGVRTPESRQYAPGTGYGLWFSSRLAERLGGSIEPYSEGVGKGSVFTLRLPKANPSS